MSLFCESFARTNYCEFRENADFENFKRTYSREFRDGRPNHENKFSRTCENEAYNPRFDPALK